MGGIDFEFCQNSEYPRRRTPPEGKIPLLSFIESSLIVYQKTADESSLLDIRRILKQESNLRVVPAESSFEPFYSPESEEDQTLIFESRFESGNLSLALKDSDQEYNLVLQNDVNTKGNTQWFYFSVSNTTAGKAVIFNIINFCKKDSLFNTGMKVLLFSETENREKGTGWFRGGTEISYFQNHYTRLDSDDCYYSLSFIYRFEHSKDTVFFAYSYPYTYSDLMHDLAEMEQSSIGSQVMTRRLLSETLGGNRCEVLTITNKTNPEKSKLKKYVFVSSRVHPGESNSSWMMKGMLEFLTGDSPEADLLRDHFVFKIVPMLNPDGVVNGNYRCSLLGVDLNRRWKDPVKDLHPTIYHAKQLLRKIKRERPVELICDLHGHSRRKNIFMYGCDVPDGSTRDFPYILSKLSPYFYYKYCSFKMQKSKESTLRIAMFKDVRVPLTYTLEASFCGQNFGQFVGLHYTTKHYQEMGEHLCKALMVYSDLEIATINKSDILQEVSGNKELLETSDNSSSGSDCDPSEDNLDTEKIPEINEQRIQQRSQVKNEERNSPKINKTLPVILNRAEAKKCDNCKAIATKGHMCLTVRSVLSKTSFKNSSFYYNHKGKRVRDQATQTVKPGQMVLGGKIKTASCDPPLLNMKASSPKDILEKVRKTSDRRHFKGFLSFGDAQKLSNSNNFPNIGHLFSNNSHTWKIHNLRKRK